MRLTVMVRAAEGARMTFDSTQRVVIGRGAGSDVRLPDASVSLRHATLRAQGSDFIVFDEGSTNGTFVGKVRIAPRTSRIVRSGDQVRVGRIWLELRIDQSPVTRDVAAVTRDLALALVSQAMRARGADLTLKVHVVEGRDQGATLPLAEEGRFYLAGRGPDCDLSLADPDVSREHVRFALRANSVVVRDLGTKNGTWIGDVRAPADSDSVWKPVHMMKIGRTVLALEEPLGDALVNIEAVPDEALPPNDEAPPSSQPALGGVRGQPAHGPLDALDSRPAAALAALPRVDAAGGGRRRSGWSVADLLVMTAALGVLALSLAGLVWLLKG
ncbi:MAG: FHA domain-containing protein [Polyangiaceae bacterium]|jgi:pSer/pThr/pTyr-binding forkhead associated (FHA) protein